MDNRTEQSIRLVIESIRENLEERITVDDMARTAMFSKYHFIRLFQRATGISPGRFLSAVRMEEAKKLLLTTSLTITEITYRVGYNSVGTFSMRFKNSVGMSPTTYRDLDGYAPGIAEEPRGHSRRSAIVEGRVVPPPTGPAGPVFVGLFPDTIPRGIPVRCAMLHRTGPFRLECVPEGSWYLLAQCLRPGHREQLGGSGPLVAACGPIEVRPGTVSGSLELPLRPMRALDPPILLALPEYEGSAMSTAAS